MEAQGGTELQHAFLEKYVDKDLLSNFQICTSIPGKVPLVKDKINILWQKNSYDQANLQDFFKNKKRHDEYDWYVFNSHWTYEKFRFFFDIPTEKSVVIKNGVTNFPKIKPYKKGDPVRLLFHPTPWRGLNVILGAMQYIKDPNITLDVYSSCDVYGSEFRDAHHKDFVELFDQAKKLPNVNYIGYKPNQYILDHITDYQIFAYPSIFEETFCISAVEAMSAGLYTIVTNFGALFETCSEWPIYVNYEKDYKNLSYAFAHAIQIAASQLHEPSIQEHLQDQQNFYKKFYSWEKKSNEWTKFLKGALDARPRP